MKITLSVQASCLVCIAFKKLFNYENCDDHMRLYFKKTAIFVVMNVTRPRNGREEAQLMK